MADEFIKGLGILTGAGLAWMVFASWYRTPSFESTQQLVAPKEEAATVFDAMAQFMMDAFFWFALVGALTFWVLVPAAREARKVYEDRQSSG